MKDRPRPNWADYANLASNVAQNFQLQQLHQILGALAALQAEQAQAEVNDRQVGEREDRLREFLWQMERAVALGAQDRTATPSGVYVLVAEIREGLLRCGLATESFRQFADKDRLGAFLERLRELRESSATKMTPEQHAEAEKFLAYEGETQELQGFLDREAESLRSRKTILMAAKARIQAWQEVKRLKNLTPLMGFSMILFGVGCVCLVSCLSLAVPQWYVGVTSMVLAFVGISIDERRHGSLRRLEHAKEREAAANQAFSACANEKRATSPPERVELFRKYGVRNRSGLKKQLEERKSFILRFSQANGL